MTKPTLAALSAPERAALPIYGCGGKGGPIDVPEMVFHRDCLEHDFAYWLGGTWVDRRMADRAFLIAMIGNAERISGYAFLWYAISSIIYYLAVRACGWRYFHGPTQRTWKDIQEAREKWELRQQDRLRRPPG